MDTIQAMQLFGTSGIRLKADGFLLHLAINLGLAAGRQYSRIVVGRDARTTSPALAGALVAGINAAGARSFDTGLLATPSLAYAARGYDAGMMITASHNPPEYNGIKCFNPDGSAFERAQQEQLEEAILHNNLETADWRGFQKPALNSEAVNRHTRAILERFPGRYDLKVVVDCGGGAACSQTPELLRQMGCRVEELYCRASGSFPRPSEPSDENLAELKRRVVAVGADLGLAHDGDGDRLMAVDEKGCFVPGDSLLVIFARGLNASRVVTTGESSMLVEKQGFAIERTPVGDNHVSWALRNRGDFGGEPSGAWIFPSFSYCPDGILAAAQLVAITSSTRLSELVEAAGRAYMIRGRMDIDRRMMPEIISRLEKLRPVTMDTSDGARLTFDGSWVLVRASGTEPVVRVTTEALAEDEAKRLHSRVLALLDDLKSGGAQL